MVARCTTLACLGLGLALCASRVAARCEDSRCQASEVEDVELLQLAGRPSAVAERRLQSFAVGNDNFVKDGEPFTVRSGSVHYPRIPRPYWRDRLRRVRALGLNTVTVYVFWNFHEEREGEFDFSGQRDIVAFLTTAAEEGLLVLFRPGPYICGEWDLGGLPWWLLPKPGIKLRTWEPQYISAVDRFWGQLLPLIRPLLYSNGGPVVMVQLENEYGSYGNCEENPDDAKYMYHLYDLAATHLGLDVVYTTIDGGEGPTPAKLEQGSPWKGNASVLATVDGGLGPGKDYAIAFENQKKFNAIGHSPKMWSELWVGWFSFWGNFAANKTAKEFYDGVLAMVEENASFSLYMAHGGTNFDAWSGANQQQIPNPFGDDMYIGYQPDITSYDYSCPVSEQGRKNIGEDGADLFDAVRGAIASKFGPPQGVFPAPIPVASYGEIQLSEAAPLFENLGLLQTCEKTVASGSALPTMESLGQGKGLILYRHAGKKPARKIFVRPASVRDRLQVFSDGAEVASIYRADLFPKSRLRVPCGRTLDLLVENMGHINYGSNIDEQKGLMGKPPVQGRWTAICLPLDYAGHVGALPFERGLLPARQKGPMFRRGTLWIEGEPQDTYLDTRGLVKGYVWANGHALGRYWETRGPQHTLYLPAPFLREGANEVIVLDLHGGGGGGGGGATIASVEWPRWLPVSWTG